VTASRSLAVEERAHRQLLSDPPGAVPGTARIGELLRRLDPLLSGVEVADAAARVHARMVGLGPLDALLGDPTVTDILVNGPGPVWVDRGGALEPTDVQLDRQVIDLLVERMLAPLGRRVDPVSPVADGRLADGSRVHVIVPPLAIDGPCLTIRRFGARAVPLAALAPGPVGRLLEWAVRSRANVVVVGATGSGKTTLLNAMAAGLAPTERVVTVEDAAELRLVGDHVVRLETRPASVEGTPAFTARDLVRNALRMRPDRLIIGEVRGGEALDLIQAMNTGHNGSLSTLHANGCHDALHRLETLVLMAGLGLPLPAVRAHLLSAVDLIVHIERMEGGRRLVTSVAEPIGPAVCAAGADDPPASGAGEGHGVRMLVEGEEPVADPIRPTRLRSVPWPGW